MARLIEVTDNVSVVYNYIEKLYYIYNRDTTTTRESAELTKQVLNIVVQDNTVSVEELQALKDNKETLYSLTGYYSNKGEYIAHIILNDYNDYDLIIDCEKGKLYINSTDMVFDLTLNEPTEYKVDKMQNFFDDYIGLYIPISDWVDIYNFIISYYSTPHIYNSIVREEDKLIYSNTFALTNYKGNAKAVYTCEFNPLQEYSKSKIGDILYINPTLKSIELLNNVPDSINTGDKVIVSGAVSSEETYTYSADGEYTVSSIKDNIIYVEEVIQAQYIYNFPKAYLINSQTLINSISRDNNTITLSTSVPNTINVGDKIEVQGTSIKQDYEQVSCDGTYIVAWIEGSNIGVQEQPNTNYTNTSNSAYVFKQLELGSISSISNNTLYFLNNIPVIPGEDSNIVLIQDNIETRLHVVSATNNNIVVQEELANYTPTYPALQTQVPNTNILISVESTTNNRVFPVCEFMVDNFKQCQDYISMLERLQVPSQGVYNNINKPIIREVSITDNLPVLEIKGIVEE